MEKETNTSSKTSNDCSFSNEQNNGKAVGARGGEH